MKTLKYKCQDQLKIHGQQIFIRQLWYNLSGFALSKVILFLILDSTLMIYGQRRFGYHKRDHSGLGTPPRTF
jgi:hypothetical protein